MDLTAYANILTSNERGEVYVGKESAYNGLITCLTVCYTLTINDKEKGHTKNKLFD